MLTDQEIARQLKELEGWAAWYIPDSTDQKLKAALQALQQTRQDLRDTLDEIDADLEGQLAGKSDLLEHKNLMRSKYGWEGQDEK